METVQAHELRPSPHAIRECIKTLDDPAPMLSLLNEVEKYPLEEGKDPQYIIAAAKEVFNDDLLGRAFMEGVRMVGSERADVILAQFIEKTSRLATSTQVQSTRDIAANMMQMITDAREGKRKAFWKTGEPVFDHYASLAPRKIIIAAAQKKQGKTRFIVDRVMRLHRMNPEIKFVWYSLEMKPEEVMMCQVAFITGINTAILEGKYPEQLTDERMFKIQKAYEYVREMPINYQTRAKNIDYMVNDLRRWVNGPTMVIIDNLGLIEIEHGISDLQHEDKVAKRLVNVRDELDACIIGLHHLSKESESRWQRDQMYRPNVSHVRGSSRVSDYANQVWLMHRPGAYRDLWSGPNALVTTPEEIEVFRRSFLLDIALNRGGEAGEVRMEHELGRSLFRELKMAA